MNLNQFVNTGADDATVNDMKKSIAREEDLQKAMNRAGLVQKEVQVKGKNGQTFTRKQWVKASADQSTDSQTKQQPTPSNEKAPAKYKPSDFGFRAGGQDVANIVNDANKVIGVESFSNGNTGFGTIKTKNGESVDFGYDATGGYLQWQGQKFRSAQELQDKWSGKTTTSKTDNTTSNNNQTQSSFTMPTDKGSLAKLLQSGVSREDIMSQAEKNGISWKKCEHPGINWMRASMAIQKAGANNGTQNTSSSTSTKKESKSVVGTDYTQLSSEKESETVEGEAHNILVGALGTHGKKANPAIKVIKDKANELRDKELNIVLSSYNSDEINRSLALAKRFNELGHQDKYISSVTQILKDTISYGSKATQSQKCNALSKLLGEDYISSGDDVYVNDDTKNGTISVHIRPLSRGNFEATFEYDDGVHRKETYDSLDSVKKAADKFIKNEKAYADKSSKSSTSSVSTKKNKDDKNQVKTPMGFEQVRDGKYEAVNEYGTVEVSLNGGKWEVNTFDKNDAFQSSKAFSSLEEAFEFARVKKKWQNNFGGEYTGTGHMT